ncbi:DUF1987 domain-containing protein [Candidatus Contubernalis alkaliaceticus]|uniref:DUF1987 domain-containing protein n=1 Tax=Candidatus Contubernalis alkaliaceticus TaxID=338645 RepID=UPI001F4BF93A|nr:DUF1987 domain-containing protein [Candidatus Contubernalis alkalaceticus]UNC90809.1 DUF1987 domain-containing protein [Candidatus Contubernalis alkalaceticus]
MQNLVMEQTNSTPYINFDVESGLLTIRGESFPENAIKFYEPVIQWLIEYIEQAEKQIIMEFEIIYFNSSTSKIFMIIFDLLDEEVRKGKKIEVHWRCDKDNETAIECGEEFEEDLSNLPFKIIEF